MPEKKEVKLQFAKPVGMPSIFADQATMQTLGDVILMTFYQSEPQLLIEESTDVESITAYPVARLAIRPEVARKMIIALSKIAGAFEGDES